MSSFRNYKSVLSLLGAAFAVLCFSAHTSELTGKFRLIRCVEGGGTPQGDRLISFARGDVEFATETGRIYCDSASYDPKNDAILIGNVLIDDADYLITADSVRYNIANKESEAWGRRVKLWSYADSILAVGQHARFDREAQFIFMDQRPLVYLGYPDTANMIEILSDEIEYDGASETAKALGKVIISSEEVSTQSDCAVMNSKRQLLDLFGSPSVRRGNSIVSGELISLQYESKQLKRIDVIDSARAEFKEPVDSLEEYFDESILSGKRLIFDFIDGDLATVLCRGEAYSWYYPSPQDGSEENENSASGDSIRFYIDNEVLQRVVVTGGAVGTFISSTKDVVDSIPTLTADTVDYSGHYIEYDLADSLIILNEKARIKSGTVSLEAHRATLDTHDRVIESFAAAILPDTLPDDAHFARMIQPGSIPVVLRDGSDETYGDYLQYSIDTKKGRIIQSKAEFQEGLYYGQRLYREQEDIFYIENGRYTTCDANEPHFHFLSSRMKLIEGNKLMARPVVFYIERLPLLVLPFYVIPLKKGRHSGILPFTFGKFERGDRWVKNIGYYWAASEYVDWLGSFDYYDIRRTFTLNSRLNFVKRYVLDGFVSTAYTRESGYNSAQAVESKRTRWALNGAYNHQVTPSLNLRANGSYQSDATYYNDFSDVLDERLNRQTKSKVNFSKRFGKRTSLSGEVSHTVNLDAESRSDVLPSMGLSLPPLFPFGNGYRDEDGKLQQRWYQKLSLRYSPRLINFSSRVKKQGSFVYTFDSTMLIDVGSDPPDTTFLVTDSSIVDTNYFRSRKKYTKISHNPALNLPAFKLFQFVSFSPRVSYNETWFKIHETDQSLERGIDASRFYRTYSYSGSVSSRTALYGTVRPNLFGLAALRHVITPSLSYRWSPDIDLHPEARAFAGGGAGSRKSSSLSFSINQLFQAKTESDGDERSYDLLSTTSGFSYNYLEDETPYSKLSTSMQSSALRLITLSGNMVHSFYKPGTTELDFWSPYLQSFSLNANWSIGGSHFIFDEPAISKGADSASGVGGGQGPRKRAGAGSWNLSASYSYRESGRGDFFRKSSFLRINMRFNLTPSTSVNYSQSYDIDRNLTIHNSVNIVRKIHCWTGRLYWVPIGSNRGFGFKLHVTQIPEIKIDNSYDSFITSVNR